MRVFRLDIASIFESSFKTQNNKIMKKILLLLFVSAIIIPSAFAQSKKIKRMQAAIDVLLETEFMTKYKDYKSTVEQAAINFKPKAEYYEAAKVKEIEEGFEATRADFNKILEDIKKDLQDKDTREIIVKKPDYYAGLIDYKLEKAMDNFHNNVAYKISDLTGEEVVGFGILEISLIFKFVTHLVNNFSTINKGFKQMSEEFLQENFMQPLEINSWNDLGSMLKEGVPVTPTANH